jgi:uncharacterized protein Yka (UPF0111/DUF47 family)
VSEANSPNWFTKVFAPKTDFYELLSEQAEKTLEGIVALQAWVQGGARDRCQQVRDCEHDADRMVLNLQLKLVDSFITPFDREDLYDLSARLDEVINAAKATVREIEALEAGAEDSFMNEMVTILVEGTRCLCQSIRLLKHNLAAASEEADLARKSENRASKVYRKAVHHLFSLDDFKTIQRSKEVYRYLIQIAERIDEVAVKMLHVIIKIR